MIGAAVKDGEGKLDGLHLGVGAESVALRHPIAVSVKLDFRFARSGMEVRLS